VKPEDSSFFAKFTSTVPKQYKKHTPFTDKEVEALVTGVEKLGVGQWERVRSVSPLGGQPRLLVL